MYRLYRARLAAAALLLCLTGCTSLNDYLHNGFKVGPNYCPPTACVAKHWIDQSDLRVEPNPEILNRWWTVFNDPKLNELVWNAYQQNLTLKEAGMRILQARALRAIAAGNLFPQLQDATGSYSRSGIPGIPNATFFDQWNFDFNLQWELDFWGRFRRAVAAADDNLQASCFGYDAVLVTLLGDVAQNYVFLRTDQERIKLLQANVEVQRNVLRFIDTRFKAGFRQTELDLDQAVSNLKQTEAQILPLQIDLRQREDQLCVLLGMPPTDLEQTLGIEPIPVAPPEVVLGIPAELIRRRPDVRQAERLAAAQAEEIGIAQADLYPAFFINGTLGYSALNFPDLFRPNTFNSRVGPSFQWNLLNYGRIVNNVRFQDAKFQELVLFYQNTVLEANKEVEDGLVTYLRSQRQAKLLDESVVAAERAVKIVVLQYEKGAVDFNRYAVIEQNLVTQQDIDAQARGQIAQGLVAVYRALGGGWEIRLNSTGPEPATPVNPPAPAEPLAAPMPNVPAPPAAPQ
jgi:NodT family efflux transporter outer membrane factor (OMF) lipoprotein